MNKKIGFLLFFAFGMMAWTAPLAAQTDTLNLSLNLFRPSTDGTMSISFTTAYTGSASLIIYNTAGELIKDFKAMPVTSPGTQTFPWDGTNTAGTVVASGVYVVRLRLDLGVIQKKFILIHQ